MAGVSNNAEVSAAMALHQYQLYNYNAEVQWTCNPFLMVNYHQTPTPTPSQQARRHRSLRRCQRKPKEVRPPQLYKPRAPRVPVPPPPPPSSSARGVNPSKVRFLFAKQLQNSDVSAAGRIVIPKREAEMHLPVLEAKEGFWLHLEDMDIDLKVWTVRFRFWPNHRSRMYVMENTKGLIAAHGLEVGDTILMFKDDDAGSYAIGTRKSPMRMTNAQYQETMMMMNNLMSANYVPRTRDDGLYYNDKYNYLSSTNVVSNNSVYEYEHPMDNFYGTGMDQLEPLYRQLHRTPSFESIHNFSNFL